MSMDELIAKLEQTSEGSRECIYWPGKVDSRGRARVWADGKLKLVHRILWERKHGPIAPGMMLCHHCDNGGCLNLSHIYVGTHAENMRDMKERRRYFAAKDPERVRQIGRANGLRNNWAKGDGNPKAKLTAEQAAAIRVDKRPTRLLVEAYGVSRTTIQRIRGGSLWSN